MDRQTCESVVLLPIQPKFAEPIIQGTKRVEFRKVSFSKQPSHVVIYSSSPVQRVVGYFTVTLVDEGPVGTLWDRYSEVGGIDHEDFLAYYDNRDEGVVLVVGNVVALNRPVTLQEAGLETRPPQGFKYLSREVLSRLVETTP